MTQPERDLIDAYLGDRLEAKDHAALQELLRRDADARRLLRDLATVDAKLERLASTEPATVSHATSDRASESPAVRRLLWLNWRPLTAAAAGIAVGLFCASVVFAYVVPSLGTSEKEVSLLEESFESGPVPLVTGVPIEPGRWSGDFTEVVGEQQGVKPESGGKMLRILRADYERKPNAQASRVADVYRLIDVRPYRQKFADGSAVVQLSAGINAFAYPAEEDYAARMTLHAFDEAIVSAGTLRIASARDENCLAAASAGPVRFYRNPTNWRRLTSDLRVPPNTDFLLIHLTISAGRGTPPEAGFGGHYIDDVRLTLRDSPLR